MHPARSGSAKHHAGLPVEAEPLELGVTLLPLRSDSADADLVTHDLDGFLAGVDVIKLLSVVTISCSFSPWQYFRTSIIIGGEARAYPREAHTLVPRSKDKLLASSVINGLLGQNTLAYYAGEAAEGEHSERLTLSFG
jgi:hypothetical protein